MAQDFLIVSKKMLPDYMEKVIAARKLLESHEVSTVTEAVRRVGISRNTYYKYKDYVFMPEEALDSRRASVSMILGHKPGVLSAVLYEVYRVNCNIITISQSTPVALRASVNMVLDITNMKCTVTEMIEHLKAVPEVHEVQLDAVE